MLRDALQAIAKPGQDCWTLSAQTAGVEAQQAALFREKMEGVERWMELRGLPRHMRTDIVSYYSEVWTQHQGALLAPLIT